MTPTEQIQLGILWRDPPLEHDAARAGHGDQVAVPRRHRRVPRQRAMRAVVGFATVSDFFSRPDSTVPAPCPAAYIIKHADGTETVSYRPTRESAGLSVGWCTGSLASVRDG